MAITLQPTPLNAAVDAVAALFDDGSVEFLDGATVLVAVSLEDSPGGDVFPPAGTAPSDDGETDATRSDLGSFVGIVAYGTVTTTGICDGFQVKDSGGAVILSGTVSDQEGNGDFKLSDLAFGENDIVVINTMKYSQPAAGA
jgi:hypothetical protein